MFGSIFGRYQCLIASIRASYGHDRCLIDVLWIHQKSLNFLSPQGDKKFVTNSYVDILQRLLHSGLFFLLSSNSELKRMPSMMVSPPTATTPHMKQIHLCCGYCLKFNIIGCLFPAGLAMNRCLRREIIPTIKCIKSSYYTQFNSTLAMSGVINFIIHFHFTQYI